MWFLFIIFLKFYCLVNLWGCLGATRKNRVMFIWKVCVFLLFFEISIVSASATMTSTHTHITQERRSHQSEYTQEAEWLNTKHKLRSVYVLMQRQSKRATEPKLQQLRKANFGNDGATTIPFATQTHITTKTRFWNGRSFLIPPRASTTAQRIAVTKHVCVFVCV